MKTKSVSILVISILLVLSLALVGCTTTEKRNDAVANESNVPADTTSVQEESGDQTTSKDTQRKKEIEKQQFMERLCR
ncbi:MAG: hypothetical protein L3V56_14020 [Candidatus Magnetoovum sp. WYHC-5]|nr:hypothetical protein [Candidatus Magnetoovum sp. WYHC-5]